MESNFFSNDDFEKLFKDSEENDKNTKTVLENEEPVAIKYATQNRDYPRSSVKPNLKKVYLKFIALFLGIFILTFLIINFSALSKKAGFFVSNNIFGKTRSQIITTPAPQPTTNFDPQSSANLLVPKINVEAPIIWNIPEEQTEDKLLEGVVHLEDTALPGNAGNIFITGHSSYYSWSKSPYKNIFSLLPAIETGDKIYIQYQNKSFTYEVTSTKVVSPDNLSVLEQTPEHNLTLMTCVPVGTNLNRLIVLAKEISTN